MRIRILLLFVLLSFMASGYVLSQEVGGVMDAPAPSQETWQEIEHRGSRPSLRYGPGEGGDANKETEFPLGESDLTILLLLSISSITYGLYTNKRHKHNRANKNNINI